MSARLRPEHEAPDYSSSSSYGSAGGCTCCGCMLRRRGARGAVAAARAASTRGWPAAARRSIRTPRGNRWLSCGVFCRRQATIRLTSGICAPHSRNTSGVQAICCSQVPRYSCDDAARCTAMLPPMAIARLRTIRCVAWAVLSSNAKSLRFRARGLHAPCSKAAVNETNAATKVRATQQNVKRVPRLLHLADLLHRRDQPRAVFGDEF